MVAPRARTLRAGVLCALVVLCLVSVLAPLSAHVRQQSDVAALTEEVGAARARVEALEAATARWEDPAYVAAQARARLHYALPGETAYVVLGAAAADEDEAGSPASGPTGAELGTDAGAPVWYDALRGSVVAAGRP